MTQGGANKALKWCTHFRWYPKVLCLQKVFKIWHACITQSSSILYTVHRSYYEEKGIPWTFIYLIYNFEEGRSTNVVLRKSQIKHTFQQLYVLCDLLLFTPLCLGTIQSMGVNPPSLDTPSFKTPQLKLNPLLLSILPLPILLFSLH